MSPLLQALAEGPHSSIAKAEAVRIPRTQTPVNDLPIPDYRDNLDPDDEGPEFWDDDDQETI